AGFVHAGYLNELTGLRNQLEAALSGTTQQMSDAPVCAVDEIVTRIKTLQAATTLESAPARTTPRPQATVEEAITTRIRQRREDAPPQQPEMTPLPVSSETTAPLAPTAPASLLRLFQDKGEHRSIATAIRKRPVRPRHRFEPRQLSLLQSEGVPRPSTASSQDRPEL